MIIATIIIATVAVFAGACAVYLFDCNQSLAKSEICAWKQADLVTEKAELFEQLLKKTSELWLVGQYKAGKQPYVAWDLVGIFVQKEQAKALCTEKSHFLALIRIGENLLKATETMPKIEYPLVKGAC